MKKFISYIILFIIPTIISGSEIDLIKVQNLYRDGKFKQALEEINELSNTYESTELYYDIGLLQVALGNYPEAEKAFLKSIELNQKFYPSYESLVEIYINRDAQSRVEQIILLSKNRLKEREFKKLEHLKDSYLERKQNKGIQEVYGLIKKGEYKNALKILGNLKDSYLKDYYSGFCHSSLGKIDAAITDFEKAFLKNTNSKDSVVFLINLHERNNNSDQSVYYLNLILDRWGADLSFSLHLIRLYMKRSEFKKALKVAKDLEYDYSHNKQVLTTLAELYLKTGNKSKSLAKYIKNIHLHKRDLNSYFQAESIYIKQNQINKAIGLLEKAKRHFPKNKQVKNSLSRLYKIQKDARSSDITNLSDAVDFSSKESTEVKNVQSNPLRVEFNIGTDDYLNIEKVSHRHLYEFETTFRQVIVSKPIKDSYQVSVSYRVEETENKDLISGSEIYKIEKNNFGMDFSLFETNYYLQTQFSFVNFEGRSSSINNVPKTNTFDSAIYGQYSFSKITLALGFNDSHYFQQEGNSFSKKDLKSIYLSETFQIKDNFSISSNQSIYDYELGYDYHQIQISGNYQFANEIFLSNSFAKKYSYENTWNYHLHLLKDFQLTHKFSLGLGYDYDQDFSYDILSHRIDLHGRYSTSEWSMNISTYAQKFYNKVRDEDYGVNINISISSEIF